MSWIGKALVPVVLQVQRLVIHVVFLIFHGLKVRGKKFIPRSGAAVLAPNHQTRMDALPIGYRVPQPVYCAVDRDYFHKPFMGWWLRTFRGVPLGDRRDRDGYKRCLEVLKRGDRLIMFPEGSLSRDGKLRKLMPGVARAALTCGADVVPVTIVGAFEVWPRHRRWPKLFRPIVIKFYPPIRCEVTPRAELKRRSEEVTAQLEKIMKRRLEAWRRIQHRRAASRAAAEQE